MFGEHYFSHNFFAGRYYGEGDGGVAPPVVATKRGKSILDGSKQNAMLSGTIKQTVTLSGSRSRTNIDGDIGN